MQFNTDFQNVNNLYTDNRLTFVRTSRTKNVKRKNQGLENSFDSSIKNKK